MRKIRPLLICMMGIVLMIAAMSFGLGEQGNEEPVHESIDSVSLNTGFAERSVRLPGEMVCFDYTPASDGIYTFSVANNSLLSSSGGMGILIDQNDHVLAQKMSEEQDGMPVLRLTVQLKANEKVYFCVKPADTHAIGSVSAEVVKADGLYVSGTRTPATQTDLVGESVNFSVDALSDSGSSLSYTWYRREGGQLVLISNESGSSYAIPLLTSSAEYVCRVSDGTHTEDVAFSEEINQSTLAVVPTTESRKTVNPGTRVVLSVKANQSDIQQYQWEQKRTGESEWTVIANAASDQYTIQSAQTSGRYRCVVRNTKGETAQTEFEITVGGAITAGADQEIHSYQIAYGGQQNLSVSAYTLSGGSLTYQWYRRDNNGTVLTEIAGATQHEYLAGIPAGQGSVWYVCVIRDSYGNEAEVEFYLRQESDLTVHAVGDYYRYFSEETRDRNVELSVRAEATVGAALSYQWYRSVGSMTDYGWLPIEGATDSTYTVQAPLKESRYLCKVSDGFAVRSIRYSFISETIGGWDFGGTVSVRYGETAELYKGVYGSGGNPAEGITYQWYQKTGERWTKIDNPNEDKSRLITAPVTEEMEYICYYSDDTGMGAARFLVVPENRLTVQARNEEITVSPNGRAEMAVVISGGSGNPVCQWYRGSYQEDSGKWSYEIIDGAMSLIYAEACERDTRYLCTVKDGAQTASATVQVWIENDLVAEAVGETERLVWMGFNTTLSVRASSSRELYYEWYRYEGAVENRYAHKLYGKVSDTLEVQVHESATYECRVMAGSFAKSVFFRINALQDVSASHGDYSTGTQVTETLYGSEVTLYARGSCNPGNGVYQWYDDSWQETLEWGIPRILEEPYAYTISNIKEDRRISFRVADGRGNEAMVFFLIRVKTGLRLLSEAYQNPEIERGKPLILSVQARNQAELPMEYEWSWKFSDQETWTTIPEATESSYTSYYAENRHYRCIVTAGNEKVAAFYYPRVVDGPVMKIPDDVSRIEAEAFAGDRSVQYIELGANVTEVGFHAFADMGTILIKVANENTVFDENAFSDSRVTIICPENSNVYRYALQKGFDVVTDE